eukprot:Nk52_evm107s485 gene=Nk52_evmTU107s485
MIWGAPGNLKAKTQVVLLKASSILSIPLLVIFTFFFLADARPCDFRGGGCSDTAQKHELLRRSSSSSDSISAIDVWATIERGFIADHMKVKCKLHSSYTGKLDGYPSYKCNDNVCASYTPPVNHMYHPGNEIGPYCWFGCTLTEDAPGNVDLESLLKKGTLETKYEKYISCSGTVVGKSAANAEIKLAA